MELRHLRYFVAVGEEQHYNRAAQRLRVAQPARSRQIQDLEEEIGFKLFDRLPRGVKLSVAGQCFMEDARRITDLKLPLPFALVWRRDNASALLAKFVADVRSLPDVEAFAKR